MILFVVFPLVAYLIGSTPFGVIIARCRGVDLRKVGSGNVGATNVVRSVGQIWGYLCFLLDVTKGFVPAFLAGLLLAGKDSAEMSVISQASWLSVGCGAIFGHVFSFWLKFKGGKGVATALGVVLGIFPYFTYAGICALGIWIGVTLISRYVSLGSIIAALAFLPLFALFNMEQLVNLWPLLIFAAAMIILILVRHRTNIRRLLKGQENKIGQKAS